MGSDVVFLFDTLEPHLNISLCVFLYTQLEFRVFLTYIKLRASSSVVYQFRQFKCRLQGS